MAATPVAADVIPLRDSAWYLGFEAGANVVPEISTTVSGAAADVDLGTGFMAAGEAGVSFGPSFRAGAELGFRGNDVDSVSGAAADTGGLRVLSLMANFTFDIPTGTGFVPYVGGGVGGARVSASDLADTIDDSDITVAYQFRAGLNYAASPSTSFGFGYRYFGTGEAEFDDGGTRSEIEYDSHAITVGLVHRFGVSQPAKRPVSTTEPAPPPPPPAPEPEPQAKPAPPPEPPPAEPAPRVDVMQAPMTFLVFFDWNKSNVKPEARTVIEKAAEHYKAGGHSFVELIGHADRSGTRDYNLALSRRRAENVKEVLVEEGVPEDEIGVTARGEDDPLIPTPDGVREPRNRRVEIVIP